MRRQLFLLDIILSRLTKLQKCILEIIKEYEMISNGTIYELIDGFDHFLVVVVGNKLVVDGIMYRLSYIRTKFKEVAYHHFYGQGEIHAAKKPIELTNKFVYFFPHQLS